ncbi:MAG: hypothetical protein U0414_03160 [Polyangiaceae bacterium]
MHVEPCDDGGGLVGARVLGVHEPRRALAGPVAEQHLALRSGGVAGREDRLVLRELRRLVFALLERTPALLEQRRDSLRGPLRDVEHLVRARRWERIAHAQAAFALASAFAGQALGPEALPEAAAPLDRGLEDLVRALVEEGCVAETVGVGELLATADLCTDPVLADHHRQIAGDELRHSALAWRALRWLLTEHPSLVEIARAAFDEAIARSLSSLAFEAPAPSVGLLGSEEITRARRDVIRLVVAPARKLLLG